MSDRFDVFLTHSATDAGWVEGLVVALRRAGFEVCLDARDEVLGAVGEARLPDAVRRTQHGILIVSESSVAAGWLRQEYAAMRNRAGSARPRLTAVLRGPMQPPDFLREVPVVPFLPSGVPSASSIRALVETLPRPRALLEPDAEPESTAAAAPEWPRPPESSWRFDDGPEPEPEPKPVPEPPTVREPEPAPAAPPRAAPVAEPAVHSEPPAHDPSADFTNTILLVLIVVFILGTIALIVFST